MELLKQLITRILGSGLLSTALVLVRAVTVLMVLYVIWRCYTSFKKGQRRKDPVVMLEDAATGAHFPVLYWENSIGRSRSCDIQIPDNSVSRDHAVLMRREEGWFVCDTGSHAGTRVRNKQITEPTLVQIGDKIRMGSTTLTLRNASDVPQKKRSMFTGFSKEAASPFKLMLVVTLVQMSLTLQLMIGTGEFRLYPAAPFVILFTASWVLYFFSRRILKRVSFEIETVGLLLSSIGILLLSGEGLDTVKMQIAAFGIGIVLFCFLVWFMSDLERVMKLRLYIAIGAILLFVANLVLGKDFNGSRNWIFIGPFSFQPSEFIKIAFVFVGASTLDHLQTKKNITEFIVFAAICLAFLFLMRDFGTALIFFACFLIIAFMRSGSFRTIFLILAAACFGVFLILQFKPYVAQRFSGWMHVWEHTQDSLGYQQVRTMTYIASGGLFGLGLGNGILKYVAAGDSDLAWQYHYMLNEYRLHEKLCGFVFTEFHDVVNEFNGYYRIDNTDKDFGYQDFCRGMSLCDLHAADFLAVDCPPMQTVAPGAAVAVPLVLSSFSDAHHGETCSVEWELWHDGLQGRVCDGQGAFALPEFGWGTTSLPALTVTMPQENAAAVLSLYLKDSAGNVIMRNFTTFDVRAALPETMVEIPVCQGKTQGFALVWNALMDDKLCMGGEGEVSYEIALPAQASALRDLTIYLEASSKRVLSKDRKDIGAAEADLGFMRGYRVDRGAFENSYWMTDESRLPSTVDVLINGEAVQTLFLENDWADARGMLSWHRQPNPRKLDEAGSFGEQKRIAVPSRLLPGIQSAGKFTLTLRVRGEGGLALAEEVVRLCDEPNHFQFVYDVNDSIEDKLNAIATKVYHADGVVIAASAKKQLKQLTELGFDKLPICMAKTQFSFSDDASKLGAPRGFKITVRDLKVNAGAGFLVAKTGDIMTMPGLPKVPSAEKIDVDENGKITGLF